VTPPDSAPVDGRAVRAAEAVTVVLVLGGFVFRAPLLVPLVAIVDGLGGVVGLHAHPVHALYRATVARHLDPARVLEAPSAVRALHQLTAGLCAVASLALAIGVGIVGWPLALAAAAAAAVDATTGFNAAIALRDRFNRR